MQMRVVNVHGVNDVRLDPAERIEPGDRDVLVRVAACGVCGTDITFIKAGVRRDDGPMPLGHEAAGKVVAVGSKVVGVEVGQRVVVNPMVSLTNVIGNGGTEGAFTEELLVRDAAVGRALLSIPDDLRYEIAALTEPLAVAMHGVNRAEPKPGDKAVVFGAGPIGLGAILWLSERGLTDIVAVDLHPERLERARALGAGHVIHAGSENLGDRLKEIHGTSTVLGREVAATQIYIDAAGAPSILGEVVPLARQHARMVVIAAHRTPVALDLQAMLATEMTITTAIGYPVELPQVLAELPRLQDRLQHFISHRYAFDRVLDALKVAGSAEAGKVMVMIDEVDRG
jgi:threonine dehydrogenase-like Zn-dependent dehydrogenase